jgi:hypothetical protein
MAFLGAKHNVETYLPFGEYFPTRRNTDPKAFLLGAMFCLQSHTNMPHFWAPNIHPKIAYFDDKRAWNPGWKRSIQPILEYYNRCIALEQINLSNTNKECSNSGVSFVSKVPDKCQSLIQSLEKVEWEKIYIQDAARR